MKKRNTGRGDMYQGNSVHGWDESVNFPMSADKQAATPKAKKRGKMSALTVILTAVLILAPIAGVVATQKMSGLPWFGQAQAATFELEVKDNMDNDEEELQELDLGNTAIITQSDSTAGTDDMDLFNIKRLGYEVSEGGIIENAENIIIEPETKTLRFVDASKDGKIAFKADEGYELQSAELEGVPVAIEGNLLIIPASSYGTLRVTFVVKPQEAPAYVPEAVVDNPDNNGAGGGSGKSGKNTEERSYGAPMYTPDPEPEPEPEPAPAPEQPREEPAPQSDEPSYEAPAPSGAPAPTAGEAGMSGDILAMAHEIFDRYNDWRASQGLNRTQWDGRCCDMAMGSAQGCASRRKLIHRLGIPGDLQTSYSDILQYASWRMSGDEAIDRWSHSSGHAAQMRCPTAQNAACAVYEENGIYWFAIVYTFSGTNIG